MLSDSYNYNAIDNSSNLIEILSIPSRLRTEKGVNKTIQYIKNLFPFANIFHLNNLKNERALVLEIASVLYHRQFNQHTIIKRAGEIDSKVFVILKGEVAELAIKFEKIKLTEEEYLIHLIKLELVNETELLAECLKQNKTKYIINANSFKAIAWIKQNHPDEAMSYINKANEEINQLKRLHKAQSVEYFLKITNAFDIEEHNNIRKDSKMKYLLLIPSYCYQKSMSIGDYIGTFSLNPKYKTYSTYITIEDTSMGLINKHASVNFNSNVFRLISNFMKEDLCELTKYFFIFQTLEQHYLENVLSPLMSYKTVMKGDMLMRQNSCFEGIYLIKNGEFKISTKRSLEEMMILIIELKQSLDNFIGVVTNLKSNLLEDYNYHYDISNNSNDNGKSYNQQNKMMKEIVLLTTHSRHIIGLNECFSSKTDIVHFDVECTSEAAEVFFLPKESYFSIIEKNDSVKSRSTKLIEQNAQYYIQTLRRFREKAIKETQYMNGKTSKREIKTMKSLNFPLILSSNNIQHNIFLKQFLLNQNKSSRLSLRKETSIKGSIQTRTISQGLLKSNRNKQEDTKCELRNTFNGNIPSKTPNDYQAPLKVDFKRNTFRMLPSLSSYRIKDWTTISLVNL